MSSPWRRKPNVLPIQVLRMRTASAGGGGGGLPTDVVAMASSPTGGVFDFTGLSLSSYQRVTLYLDGVRSDTNNTVLQLQFYVGGVLQTTSYRWRFETLITGVGTPDSNQSASDSVIRLCSGVDTATNANVEYTVEISNGTASLYKEATFSGANLNSSGDGVFYWGAGVLENAGTVDGIKISGSGGTLTSGKAMLLARRAS